MTPDDRRARIGQLCESITSNDSIHAEACAEIVEHVDKIAEELDDLVDSLNEAERELDEARDRASGAEGRVTHDYDVPVRHEAKGRIMEGQQPAQVLEWVLSHIAGEPVLIA